VKSEIRIPETRKKSEIRNPNFARSEIIRAKAAAGRRTPGRWREARWPHSLPDPSVTLEQPFVIRISDFGFLSDFGFRASVFMAGGLEGLI
jgi:hypothetical protein